MPTLLIREVTDELNAAQARSAARNHRSKEKEALHLLQSAVGAGPVDWTDFLDKPRRTFPKCYADEIRKAGR